MPDRQSKINKTMALEDISYFEASKMFTNISENPQSFPRLPSLRSSLPNPKEAQIVKAQDKRSPLVESAPCTSLNNIVEKRKTKHSQPDLRYGHLSKNCNSKSRCGSCGVEHLNKKGEETVCPNLKNLICVHCSLNHNSTDRSSCPEFDRQSTIYKTMALENISYFEASKMFTKVSENHPQSFPRLPSLRSSLPNHKKVQIVKAQDRRSPLVESAASTSFNYIVIKRKTEHCQPGYNKEAHQKQLIEYSSRQFRPSEVLLNNGKTDRSSESPSSSSVEEIVLFIKERRKEQKTNDLAKSLREILLNKEKEHLVTRGHDTDDSFPNEDFIMSFSTSIS
ncbi:hypothetical protein HHI36_022420 [Cryptolaemus montrouzieri]|uniref:Uncharacterized protein n=1 Tax=Cryptolaemus montrouzieri TaxID=559131 RepID=A0ABD2MZR3_9CUCU